MQNKNKFFTTTIIGLLAFLISLAVLPAANAAGSITVTPTTGAPSGAITVSGTGFAASQVVGICVGTEVIVTGEVRTNFNGSGMGPWTSTLAHFPIKPGSFSMHWDTAGTASDWTDKGDGTLTSDSAYSAGATINYATGVFGRTSTVDLTDYALTATCTYTYYQYNVTPLAGVTTNAAGDFSSTVTVPSAIANGNYVVTAVDAKGNKGTTALAVVPEGLSVGLIVVLSAATIVASAYLLKKPKNNMVNIGKPV